jgi:hypothetical protein
MAITIDSGTFEVGNSFVTVAESNTFATDRGYSDWVDGDDEDKESALIRTFDFLSVQNWKSTTFDDSVPIKIKNAQCLGAIRELDTLGSLQPDVDTGIKSESIDGVLETEYFAGGPGQVFSSVENMISPYLNKVGCRTNIVRGGGTQ